MQLSNKTIWIVGASHGIGKSLAVKLSENNNVIVSARSTDDLKKISEKHKKTQDIAVDVGDEKTIKKAVDSIVKSHKTIDLVIYAPAIYDPKSLEKTSIKEFEKTIDINLTGAMRVVSYVLPVLKKNKGSGIALFGSVAGYSGLPNSAAYGISKAGILHMGEVLFQELKKEGVQTFLISPGFVKTRLTAKNKFSMPFIVTPEKAADYIISGIEKNKFEIHFPPAFTLILKFLRILPYPVYFALVKKLIK